MKTLFSLIFFAVILSAAGSAGAVDTKARQMILVDDTTGTVLAEKQSDEKMHPSSMSKLMTVYIVFERLKEGSLKMTDQFQVSENAWRKQGSKSFVELGASLSVEDLLRGIIIQSGNDACIVIAEGLAGSEDEFAKLMNAEAQKLGLQNSHFTNATGWPDPDHLMSARDLTILSHHIIHDFPEFYHFFSEKEFVYHGIKQGNRNMLLYGDNSNGVDGLKTGHSDAGGYGMTVSAVRGGRRLIAVVNGLSSMKERADESEMLLNYGFNAFRSKQIVKKGDVIDSAPVWFGEQPSVGLVAGEDVAVTLPTTDQKNVKLTLSYNSPVPAPVAKGSHIADLVLTMPGAEPRMIPLVAADDVNKLSGFKRLIPVLETKIFGHR